MPRGIDLHLHTRASDGQWTVAGLVARAAASGIGTISVTDHDTVASLPEVLSRAAGAGIRALPGVEATVHWRGLALHLLLYGAGVASPAVGATLALGRAAIDAWVRRQAPDLPPARAPGTLAVGSAPRTVADLVRATRANGTIGLGRDAVRRVAARVIDDPPGLDLAEVATIAVAAGAIPVLAHPMREGALTRALDVETLERLLDDVPAIRGLEVVHPRQSPGARAALAKLATRRAMLVTAGSDSHGPARARPPVAWPADLAREFIAHALG